jgi:glycosyltransferase involved in cell wall biosynthesis
VSQKSPNILVAIPAYNCERQIARVLAGFDKKLLSRITKVIVIDDRGGDKTAEVAAKAIKDLKLPADKVEVVQNVVNLGLGGSHKMAFLYGEQMGADYVAILHGDDQAKTQELNNLIDIAQQYPEYGAILGSRFLPGSTLVGYSWERIWGNRVLNWFYTLMSLRRTVDLGSGLNLLKVADLKDHRYLGFEDRMTFNLDLLLDYYTKHTKIKFTPITWTEEDQVSNARNFDIGIMALEQILKWRFGMLKFEQHDAEEYRSKPYRG